MADQWVRRGLGHKYDRQRKLGQRPDRQMIARPRALLPTPAASVDLSHLVVDVLDQGQLGSCVANAVAQAIRMSWVRDGAADVRLPDRLLIYYQGRSAEGTTHEDSGLEPRDAFEAVSSLGYIPELAYDISRFTEPPTPEQEVAAIGQRDAGDVDYARIDGTTDGATLDLIKRSLTAGIIVSWGGLVDNTFAENGYDFAKPIKPPTRDFAGGHEMLVVGYNQQGNFKILNSWSEDFGLGGYCWFTPEYILADSDRHGVIHAPQYKEAA